VVWGLLLEGNRRKEKRNREKNGIGVKIQPVGKENSGMKGKKHPNISLSQSFQIQCIDR
jgi:hypothetical protein